MLIEVIVSATMLATLLIIIGQVIVQLHCQTRLVDQHLLAQHTLENLLEKTVRSPWSALTTDKITKLALPEIAQEKLPQVVLSGKVSELKDPVLTKRVTLRLSWQNVSGNPQQSLVLTTWVYKQPEVEP